jgi:hypothetical protein
VNARAFSQVTGGRSSAARVDIRRLRLIDWDESAVAGKTAFELVANFLGRRRVCRATGQEKRDGNGQQGFHLEML